MYKHLWKKFALLLLLVLQASQRASVAGSPLQSEVKLERSSWITWIERPWTTRYFMTVKSSDDWAYLKQAATRDNAKPEQKLFDWEEFFDPTAVLVVKPSAETDGQALSVVVVHFDTDGRVVSPHTHKGLLRGRLNHLLRIGLSEGDAVNDRYFALADWFLGVGDASTHWAPAFCNIYQRPDPATIKSDDYLYGKLFKPNGYAPLFGCREWAYQLYDHERPYIDVTSYEPTVQGKPPKSYIREFIGWARFDDHKPVIGQHEGDWYCLLDCPGGDKPGHIPDITLWAKRFDWPSPIPPTRVPTFPDPPAESGHYPYEQKPLMAPSNDPSDADAAPSIDDEDFPDVPADVGC